MQGDCSVSAGKSLRGDEIPGTSPASPSADSLTELGKVLGVIREQNEEAIGS
jgi:hypothetical protein